MSTIRKSKSKTFPEGTEFVDILNWMDKTIECKVKEVPYGGSEPSSEYVDSTTIKYLITITHYEEVE